MEHSQGHQEQIGQRIALAPRPQQKQHKVVRVGHHERPKMQPTRVTVQLG